jgi:uncharacterized hydrophobic protein (TIGR00341 family)
VRLIYALVPDQERRPVFDYLDESDIDYVVLGADGETDSVVVQFPLPTPAVEEVLDDLRDAGLADEYKIVTSAKTVETENFERLDEQFSESEDKDIAPAELRTRAIEMGQRSVIYYTMTLLSAVVAASGLLLDAPAVVVGSMVIAPQVGSALKASVGTVFDDREMVVDGLSSQFFGLLLAIAGSAAFGWGVRALDIGPARVPSLVLNQLQLRVYPGVLSVVVAVGAGLAAALSLATAVPTSLVGVMIAAALIPAAATVGIGIAWGEPAVVVGAAVLLVVNATAINLVGIGGLWGLGYRPNDESRRDVDQPRAERSVRPALAALLVLSLLFAGAGFLTFQHVAFERTATDAVEEVVSTPEYDELELVSVEAQFDIVPGFDSPDRVIVTVTRPSETKFPDLASTLQRRLSTHLGRQVTVVVEYRDVTVGTPEAAGNSTRLANGRAPR